MKKAIEIIEQFCGPYIEVLKHCERGSFLCRGYKNTIDNYMVFNHNLTNRKPLNTPIKKHNFINSYFYDKFKWPIRNGIFCYGINILKNNPYDLGYGKQYLFFPIEDFDFVYNPNVFDLYHYISDVSSNEEDLMKLTFFNDNLCQAISSGEMQDGVGNEVSVKAKSYYLVDTINSPDIIKLIWGNH